MNLKRIGLDTSKAVFTLHGVDHDEKTVLRRNIRRAELEAFFTKLPVPPGESGGGMANAIVGSIVVLAPTEAGNNAPTLEFHPAMPEISRATAPISSPLATVFPELRTTADASSVTVTGLADSLPLRPPGLPVNYRP